MGGKMGHMEVSRNQPGIEQNSEQTSEQIEVLSEANTGQDETIAGGELVKTLLTSTGLPESWVGEELGTILESAGHSPATLTLDELRSAMLAYLETTLAAVDEQA